MKSRFISVATLRASSVVTSRRTVSARKDSSQKQCFDNAASESDACDLGFGFSLRYSDELLRLLWLSARLANAVGKKASIKDVIAAVSLNSDWTDELSRHGLEHGRILADFDKEVTTIVFYAAPHTSEHWPKEMDLAYDATFRPPFTLELSIPMGHFSRSGRRE